MEKRTEIAEVGHFGLIDRLTQGVQSVNDSTVVGVGDDAAVIDAGDRYMLVSTELLLEGVHFDLTYFPLKHLGYKLVVAGASDSIAMNGTPRQVTVSIGVSARFSVEHLEELYEGVKAALSQNVHPPNDSVPSRLGQVKPALTVTFCIRWPNRRLK